jgi:cell wall-associated NlpC family hydrolase
MGSGSERWKWVNDRSCTHEGRPASGEIGAGMKGAQRTARLTPKGQRTYAAPAMRNPLLPATACLLAFGMACAQELPPVTPHTPAGDVVYQLLQQKGLVRTETANPLIQQMRDGASEMVMSAMHFLGVPYQRGGSNAEEGFDCSGFTRHVFENSIGLLLPRRADEQAQSTALHTVQREELKPGDLVFFNTMRRAFSHVGIYVGNDKFIHAPRTGAQVRIEDMRQAYWSKRFNGARRAPEASAQGN